MTKPEEGVPRGAHRPSRRAQVVEAAIRVFADQGLKASVAAVAAESGMSPASIYYHFPTKDELLTAALEEISSRISKTTLAAGGEEALDIRGAAQAVWEYHREHAAETRLLYAWAATGPEPARAVRDQFVARHVEQSRRRMSDQGRQSRLDLAVADLAARAYVRMAMDLSQAWAAGGRIAGYRRKDLIVEALIEVGERLAGSSPDTRTM
ncbi:TetR/AcrR family transcriptional regulator [Actinomadura rugatobispora]|uniref:TetR/AcrR family transcriptional regulator n=1 Tax=Actinomadura rugatobispora TaxID=1994 RepID=A0ABW1A908_9ACTN|nr:hypothetical protein GCM10010200_081460 [Actinomadura rugatobispora]